MALDLLLISDHPNALRDACLRGYWGPMSPPSADCRFLTHLAVLPPQATAIEHVARIQALEPWPEPGGPVPSGSLRFLLVVRHLHPLRRPIPLGRSPLLSTWRPQPAAEHLATAHAWPEPPALDRRAADV
jgi:hypothetical protein